MPLVETLVRVASLPQSRRIVSNSEQFPRRVTAPWPLDRLSSSEDSLNGDEVSRKVSLVKLLLFFSVHGMFTLSYYTECVLGIEPNEHRIPRFQGKYSYHTGLPENPERPNSPNDFPMSQCYWGVGILVSVNLGVC